MRLDAKTLNNRMTDRDRYPALTMAWPENKNLSFEDTCERLGLQEEQQKTRNWLSLLDSVEGVTMPIIGVVGSLNGGKSSFVASLLSEKGRNRVLIGENANEGTHRFVFWLPSQWRQSNELWTTIEQEIRELFGESLEFLSEDPEEAFAQYNARNHRQEQFRKPLIAFDSNLDDAGLGLMDCPDFERPHNGGNASDVPHLRWKQLSRIARIFSGVVFIISRDQAGAEVFIEPIKYFRREFEDLPRFLAINKVRPSSGGAEVLLNDDEIRNRMTLSGVSRIFCAYDFDMRAAESKIPVHLADSEDISANFPLFFEVASDRKDNEPDSIMANRLIQRQLMELDQSVLWQRVVENRYSRLKNSVQNTMQRIAENIDETRDALLSLHRTLLEFLATEFFPENDDKIAFTPQLAAEVAASLSRTAPWYARTAIRFREILDTTQNGVKGLLESLNLRKRFSREIEKAREYVSTREPNSGIDDHNLARRIYNTALGTRLTEQELAEAFREVLRNSSAYTSQNLRDALDEETRQTWRKLPSWQKFTLGMLGPFALIGAFCAFAIAWIDGGGTAVIFHASIAEILAALGLGGTATYLTGGQLVRALKKFHQVPFFERTMANACDIFGLPRIPADPINMDLPGLGKIELDLSEESHPPIPTKDSLLQRPILAETNSGFTDSLFTP